MQIYNVNITKKSKNCTENNVTDKDNAINK